MEKSLEVVDPVVIDLEGNWMLVDSWLQEEVGQGEVEWMEYLQIRVHLNSLIASSGPCHFDLMALIPFVARSVASGCRHWHSEHHSNLVLRVDSLVDC